MSLNALIRWLKPRELVFFDLLEASAQNLQEAAAYFDEGFAKGEPSHWPAFRQRMKDFEHKGDEITHEIIDRLNQAFVTPIEREDILALAHALDDVVDCLFAVSERLVVFRIDKVMPLAVQLGRVVPRGAEELVFLIKSLRALTELDQIRTRIRKVTELENEADAVYHAALEDLFDHHSDAVTLMKWREILGLLEDATDRVELVAKVVGSTVMRNA